jgi:hypothetical protein
MAVRSSSRGLCRRACRSADTGVVAFGIVRFLGSCGEIKFEDVLLTIFLR